MSIIDYAVSFAKNLDTSGTIYVVSGSKLQNLKTNNGITILVHDKFPLSFSGPILGIFLDNDQEIEIDFNIMLLIGIPVWVFKKPIRNRQHLTTHDLFTKLESKKFIRFNVVNHQKNH